MSVYDLEMTERTLHSEAKIPGKSKRIGKRAMFAMIQGYPIPSPGFDIGVRRDLFNLAPVTGARPAKLTVIVLP